MTRIFQHGCAVAIFLGIIASAIPRALAESAPADGSHSPVWIQRQGVTFENTGGVEADHGFARLDQKNSTLEAALGSAGGLADFYVEFYLRLNKVSNQQFQLRLVTDQEAATAPTNPGLTVTYNPIKGWGAAASAENQVVWHDLSTGKLAAGVWYHLVFTGRNWGQTKAGYTLQIFGPATTAKPVFFQITNAVATGDAAHYFILDTTAGDNPGVDVAEVQAGAIQAYQGPVARGVDTQTLSAKVMCGYQGWFGTPSDGSRSRGWRHWTKNFGPLADGNAKVDLWPDVSELAPDERFATGFKLPDGRPAEVFSSYKEATVARHFQWMRDYGIDGAFVQRFAVGLRSPMELARVNTVLANCRAGANQNGRAYAVMYDLSGIQAGEIDRVIRDWRALRREMAIVEDPAYLHHHGKPVVAVWGIGFNDHRDYTLAECRRLIEFLKHDPESGGCTVIVGVPAHWRELDSDAVSDPELLEVLQLADIISPWTVGRYGNPKGAARYAEEVLKPDQIWCQQRNLEYLPVVFPGFSWHNMYANSTERDSSSDKIPRLQGKFLWTQFLEAKRANASMIYVAMFDEVDEGTAIFKCINNVPVGEKSKFITYEGLPNDFYLKLVGAGGKLLRGEIPPDAMLETPQIHAQN